MPLQLTWMPGVLRSAGLKVAETPGWSNHGRGAMRTVRGVMCHHTVGARDGNMPSLNTLIKGRKTKNGGFLNGPLCHLGLGRDGTYYLIGAGIANHAGKGEWRGFRNGGSGFIGIEAENMGTAQKEPWPEIQLDAYVRGVAALLGHLGLPAQMCCAHREWAIPAGRKPDPHTIDMDDFRSQVASAMKGTFATRPIIPAVDAQERPTLRRGSRGVLVESLQEFLGIKADGIFGPNTEAMIRKFQRKEGLVGDGIVGPITWAATKL